LGPFFKVEPLCGEEGIGGKSLPWSFGAFRFVVESALLCGHMHEIDHVVDAMLNAQSSIHNFSPLD
jgi:hypothetical protein